MKTTRGVPDSYAHRGKRLSIDEAIRSGEALLKWYEISSVDAAVPAEISAAARSFAGSADTRRELELSDELGFAILHRCAADFYFLILSVWRGANEVWEAVYYRDASGERFRPFEAANPGAGRPLRPTFCVWELGVVEHEMKAWRRYLESPRSEQDASTWQRDHRSGDV